MSDPVNVYQCAEDVANAAGWEDEGETSCIQHAGVPTGLMEVDWRYTPQMNTAGAGAAVTGVGNAIRWDHSAPPVEYALDPAAACGTLRKTMCEPNRHYFECKHEPVCDCGKTARVNVAEGL